jgi:hypothetical protein
LTGVSRNLSISAKHAEHRTVEIDVLAAGKLRVEARPDFEQRAYAPVEFRAPLGRLRDAREYLQERGLARAVAPYDADHLSRIDLEAHVLERPDRRVAAARAPTAQHPQRRAERLGHRVALRVRGRAARADAVLLAEPFHCDNRLHRSL